ncbi:MAG: hypothetical protein OXE85_01200 [Roseovarius sp.]|nr:hypothetical protein [Roseovarius sp.]
MRQLRIESILCRYSKGMIMGMSFKPGKLHGVIYCGESENVGKDKFPERIRVRAGASIPDGANGGGPWMDVMNSGIEPGAES